jgi:pyruvate/2-oxoglutarate/acetoin dehydrogenase E1 component
MLIQLLNLQLMMVQDGPGIPVWVVEHMDTVLERLNAALMHALEIDERVFVLGEDLLDPYGGAFKVTRGLSTRFPERVLTTPISEAAITGVAAGMALRGLRPVVEIMFGDFVTLIADQLVNHASKFRWMYNDNVRVPMVVRTPMGGRRGYGPTHSQSLEKLFLGVPGLKVVAPNTLGDPAALLESSINDEDPVLFIEHKLIYPRHLLEASKGELMDFRVEPTKDMYPAYTLQPEGNCTLTIACYGYNFELVRQAALELMMEREIFVEIVLFSQLSPFALNPLFLSLERTRKLLTVEEGCLSLGWGAEVAARAIESVDRLQFRRVAGRDLPIANSRTLEDAILPSVDDIVRVAVEMTGRQ